MQRVISIALSSALSLAVLAPAVHAQTATPGGPLAEDKATIKAGRETIKQDREQLRKDRQAGNKEAVQQDVAKLKQDRQQLKKDREKFRADRRALHHKGTPSSNPAPKPQS